MRPAFVGKDNRELRDFLPPKIFDSHLHLFDRSCLVSTYQCLPRSVFGKFGGVFPLEQCLRYAHALLPEQEYHLNSLAMASYNSDFDASAVYSGSISDNRRFFAMALVSPHDTAEAVIRRVEALHSSATSLTLISWIGKTSMMSPFTTCYP